MTDAPKLTEADVLQLLRERCTVESQAGGRYAYMTHVRNAAGFDATRTFDAVAMDLWPSRGLTVDVFEVKVSRSDWQRELRKPDKAEDACKVADRFWIVAPAGCVKAGELPPTWGLIEVRGDGTDDKPWRLRTKTSAPLLHEGDRRKVGLPRGLVVGMLRSAPGAVPGGRVPSANKAELDAARAAGFEAGKAEAEREHRRLGLSADRDAEQWRRLTAALREAGVDSWFDLTEHAAGIAQVIAGDDVQQRLRFVRTSLANALEAIDKAAA